MSTGKDWLQKQRKGDLTDIAEHFGLKKCAPPLPNFPFFNASIANWIGVADVF